MKGIHSQKDVLNLPFQLGSHEDFDYSVDQIFLVLCEQLGFTQPMLFMDDEEGSLILTKTNVGLSIPLTSTEAGLIKAFTSGELFVTDSYQDIFPAREQSETPISGIEKYILLPVSVFGKPIGVFVFASQTKEDLSSLEKVFLKNFANQVGLQLYTGWALNFVTKQRDAYAEANEDFSDLIEVKREFLVQVQSLLTQALQNVKEDESLQQELFSSLSYLRSLILLSDTTVQKHQLSNIISQEQTQIQH